MATRQHAAIGQRRQQHAPRWATRASQPLHRLGSARRARLGEAGWVRSRSRAIAVRWALALASFEALSRISQPAEALPPAMQQRARRQRDALA